MAIEFGVDVVESGGNCFAVDAVKAKCLANLDASPKVESHLVVDESMSEARVVDKCVVVEKVDNAVGILTRQSPTSHLFSEFAGRVFGAGASGGAAFERGFVGYRFCGFLHHSRSFFVALAKR